MSATPKQAAVTGWFPASVKPVRRGWYEVAYIGDMAEPACALYWRGEFWSLDSLGGTCFFGHFPGDKWRGLASNPHRASTARRAA